MTAQATHIASHLMDTEYSNAAKSLLHDATRLQARNAAVPGVSLGELLSSLKIARGKDSPSFALFLVSGGGRSGNHPRYSGKQQRSSPQAVQNSRKRTRKDVVSDGSGGMEAGGVNKAEELAWIMRLIADHGKKTGQGTGVKPAPPPPGHPTTSNLKPVVTKKPSPEPEAQDPFSPLDYKTPIGNASVVHNIHLEARRTTRPQLLEKLDVLKDVGGTKSAGPAAIEDVASDSSGEYDGNGVNKAKKLAWIMGMITDHEKKTRHDTGVKLAAPPPGHPATSILRPVVKEEPKPEPEAQAPFSPLDYQTTLGNACVVHDIYLEARRTTQPRTRAEELSRRKRALRMAYKEVLAVIGDIEWHRKGTGFKSGPQSSVLVGLEQVPDENHRPWLQEKLDVLKTRQCEVRCATSRRMKKRADISLP